MLFAAPTRAPRWALTIDDGPDPRTTPALLDVLGRHGARATFFLLGERAERHPGLVARIVDEGHEIGNHTWHDEPTWRLTPDAFRESLQATRKTLERALERPVAGAPDGRAAARWFRPGSGWPTAAHLAVAEAAGLRCVLGSAVAIAGSGAGTAGSAAWLAAVVRRGTIVVLHEGPGREPVAGTVDGLLARTSRRGLAAVTLSDLATRPTGP